MFQTEIAFRPSDRIWRNAQLRQAVNGIFIQEGIKRCVTIKRQVVAFSEEQIFNLFTIEHPVVTDAGPDPMRCHFQFWHHALRVKLDTDPRDVMRFFTPRMIVRGESELRVCFQKFTDTVRK